MIVDGTSPENTPTDGDTALDAPQLMDDSIPTTKTGSYYFQRVDGLLPWAQFRCNNCKHVAIHAGTIVEVRNFESDTEGYDARLYLCSDCGFVHLQRPRRTKPVENLTIKDDPEIGPPV